MRALMTVSLVALALGCPSVASAARLVGVCGTDLCSSTEKGTVANLTTDGSSAAPYSSPSLSRDGKRLGFIKGGAPYIGGPDPSKAAKLLDTSDGRQMVLSPDGKSFAFRSFGTVVGAGGVQLESAVFIGGAAGSARYGSTSTINYPGWLKAAPIASYDGDDGMPGRVCPFPVIPSSEAPPCSSALITAPGGLDFVELAGAPNGKLIAAEVNQPATSNAATARLGIGAPSGGVVRYLTPAVGDASPAFSPDSRRVAFTRGKDTYVVPAAGGRVSRLARGLTDASWGGAALAAPAPLSATLKSPKIVLKLRCKGSGGCKKATLVLKRGSKLVGTFRIPALDPGKRRTATTRVSRKTIRAVRSAGRGGLKLTLSGSGLKARSVKVR